MLVIMSRTRDCITYGVQWTVFFSTLHIRFLHWAAFLLDLVRHRHIRMVCDDIIINNILSTFSYVLRRRNLRELVAVQ